MFGKYGVQSGWSRGFNEARIEDKLKVQDRGKGTVPTRLYRN